MTALGAGSDHPELEVERLALGCREPAYGEIEAFETEQAPDACGSEGMAISSPHGGAPGELLLCESPDEEPMH
jgi:hypothetical protein